MAGSSMCIICTATWRGRELSHRDADGLNGHHLRGSLRGRLERGAIQGARLQARLQGGLDRRERRAVGLQQHTGMRTDSTP